MELAGKRALVTGGGTGLGRQMATALAEAGADVFICGRRVEPLEETVRELAAAGHELGFVQADVTVDADLERLRERAGAIDVLVNNAGYSIRRPWLEVPIDEWREVFAVNVEGPLRVSQLFAPGMIERGWGRIVNIASIYGMIAGDPARYGEAKLDIASYFASKHAVLGLTKHMAVELGRTGVTVNALSPGMFPSPPNEAVLTPDVRQALLDGTPVHRLGSDTDLKAAIVFLASPGASFVTGHNLVVDGGWTIW
jgi:gluconate 5-dehydrogenase